MNNTLYKLLLEPIFGKKEQKEPEKEEYYEDDFTSIKRKNRLFTQKQKEYCWQKVN
jgi:hypothetical protein